jgi:LysR family transcriptional activator of nhaA
VVQDELGSGRLEQYCVVPNLYESFYAITVQRHFEPPLLRELLKRPEADVLGAVAPPRPATRGAKSIRGRKAK